MLQLKLACAIGVIGISVASIAVATQLPVKSDPLYADVLPSPEPGPAPMTVDPHQAHYAPSVWTDWNDAISAGIDYWNGRDGSTPDVRIVRARNNLCGEGAAGCAWTDAAGDCRVFIHKRYAGNRWALTAIGLHEVGHCVGKGHDDTDFVMHG